VKKQVEIITLPQF